MTLRLLSQWTTYIISILIVLACLYGIRQRKTSKILRVGLLYGLVDVVFYTIVLAFNDQHFGNVASPYRSVLQDSIFLTYILLLVCDYSKTAGWRLWKHG